MKLKKLLKIIFVFLILTILLKLQYSANIPAYSTEKAYRASNSQPFLPFGNSSPATQHPQTARELIRLEIFLLFLFLLSYFKFSFSIFQFSAVKIWIPGISELQYFNSHRLKNRAPPRDFIIGVA